MIIHFPFLFPSNKRGKKKRRKNSKNRDFKSHLSGSSTFWRERETTKIERERKANREGEIYKKHDTKV